MKKIKKILVMVLVGIMITGCGKKDLSKVYDKMTISDKNINGYEVSINLSGITSNAILSENYYITNYMNKNFKVESKSSKEMNTYYLVNNKKYMSMKSIHSTLDRVENTEDNVIEDVGNINDYNGDIPYIDTDIYLSSLKSANDVVKVDNDEYETYEYTIEKDIMKKILEGTPLKDSNLVNNTPVIVKLDKKGYVYSMEYDLAKTLGYNDILTLKLYFTNINNVNDIKIEK